MDEERPVKVNLSGKLQFEEEITVAQAAQIVGFLSMAGGSGAVLGGAVPLRGASVLPMAAASAGVTGPREALDVSGAKTNPEKIVALALYVAQDGAKNTFSVEDIKPQFRRAREASPKNFTRDLDVAIKAGWVAESDTKGEYYVMAKATDALTNGFDSLRITRASSKSRGSVGKKGKRTLETPEVFKTIDEFPVTIEGMIGFHKLKAKTDRYLWAIYLAKHLGVATVAPSDLVWLTDRLGDGISSGDMAANFRLHHKAGRLNKSLTDHRIRITPAGQEYLQSKPEE